MYEPKERYKICMTTKKDAWESEPLSLEEGFQAFKKLSGLGRNVRVLILFNRDTQTPTLSLDREHPWMQDEVILGMIQEHLARKALL